MASLIPKVNATTGSATAPGAGALVTGELAENKFTGRLYVKTEAGTVLDPGRVILSGDVTGSTATATSEAQGGTITTTLSTVGVSKGGTGLTATPANGQIPIGNGTGYTLAILTAGSGITVTNAAGTITIASSAGGVAGELIQFAGTSAPTGYLLCPTAATNVSRTTYATLFAAIGTTWGAGDGSTTFGIPYFAADNVPVQANANVGTLTNGALLAHSHTTAVPNYNGSGSFQLNGASCQLNYSDVSYTSSSVGGTQNLAAGRRVLYCVKF
jgi:hypothetical protein